MKAQVETISPEVAVHLLNTNTSNRPVRSRTTVRAIAKDIVAGRWALNGESIVVSDTGRLLDGQHRLLAIVEAKLPVRALVVRGIPEGAFTTIDSNCGGRTVGDCLAIDKVPYATHVAAVARLIIGYRDYGRLYPHGLSKNEIRAYAQMHPEIAEWVALAHPSPVITASTLAAVCCLACDSGHLSAVARAFLSGAVDGAGLERGDARHTLRELILNMKGRRGAKLSKPYEFNAVAQAWNAYVQGRELRVIRAKAAPLIEIVGSRRNETGEAEAKPQLRRVA